MTRDNRTEYIPTRSFSDGIGYWDASIDWERDDVDGDLVMNLTTNNGELSCGIRLNRTAIVDLIGELAKSLR